MSRSKQASNDAAGVLSALAIHVEIVSRIQALEACGGPSHADFARVRGNAALIACNADTLFRTDDSLPDRIATFHMVADFLAVTAFVPPGVGFMGRCYAAGEAAECVPAVGSLDSLLRIVPAHGGSEAHVLPPRMATG